MKLRFYQYLGVPDVLAAFLSRRTGERLYYFDASGPALGLASFLKLNGRLQQFKFNLHELKDSSGQALFPKIYGKDLLDLGEEIENKVLCRSRLMSSLGRIYSAPDKVRLYFRKLACEEFSDLLILFQVIAWYADKERLSRQDELEFAIEPSHYDNVLKEFALQRYGVRVRPAFSFRRLTKAIVRAAASLAGSLIMLSRSLSSGRRRPALGEDRRPRLASLYTLRGLTFDKTKRCDFPWILMSDIPADRIMIYFEREDAPATKDMTDLLAQQRIQSLAMSCRAAGRTGMEFYRPSISAAARSLKLGMLTFLLLLRESLSLRALHLSSLAGIMRFNMEYVRMLDLFKQYNIRVNVDFVDFDPLRIPRHLALRDAGGISVSQQISNWPIPNSILASSADVMFLFGPYYRQRMDRSGSRNETLVYSGFHSDYSFALVKDRARALRRSLTDKGAKFILCYFDENSSDARMSVIPHERSAFIYGKLLNWVISDPAVGLICSPKRPGTLTRRLPGIAELIKKAEATGRCVFMQGKYSADNYPTEAAQAADMVVSLLIGGSTSLECFLSGCRVLYLDLEGLYAYPEYEWGRNKLVFDDVDNLLGSVDAFRRDQNSCAELGSKELVPVLKQKDMFQDGRAASRMGQYLGWLLEQFDRGRTRGEAMAYANEQFSRLWGKESVEKKAEKLTAV
ncbi:MAG: hypothetical protein JW782_00875 [Candidatus Saganbacteria bacterium]|nr:hypothetical protein [Candidatus Saganbacteria bacterium]